MTEVESTVPIAMRTADPAELDGGEAFSEEAEFEAAFEDAAPRIAEMAAQARAMRRAGSTRKFPV